MTTKHFAEKRIRRFIARIKNLDERAAKLTEAGLMTDRKERRYNRDREHLFQKIEQWNKEL